jgi:hypothetical protein
MTKEQRAAFFGTSEKRNHGTTPGYQLVRQVRDAEERGREIMASERRGIEDDVANRQRLGLQPPLHVRTAAAMAKIKSGQPASADHSTWGASDPLKQKSK